MRLGQGAAFFDPERVEKLGKDRAKKRTARPPLEKGAIPKFASFLPECAPPVYGFALGWGNAPCVKFSFRSLGERPGLRSRLWGENRALMGIHLQNFFAKMRMLYCNLPYSMVYSEQKGRCFKCPRKAQT